MSSEGLDIPSLDTLVFATPRTDIVQSVGRIVRQHDDKCDPLIIDIDDQHATFRAGWKKRLLFYRKHSYAIQEESYQTHRDSKDSNCSSSESSDASESLDDEDESSDSDELTGAHHRTHTHMRRNRASVKDTLRSTPAQGDRDEPCAAQQRASRREEWGRAVVSEHKRGGCNKGGYSGAGNGSGGADNDDESMDDGDESAFINDDNEDLDKDSDGSYHIGDDAASDSISGPVGESGVGSVATGGERLEGGANAMCRDEPDQLREGDLREGMDSDAHQQVGVRVRRREERHKAVGGSPWCNSGPERRDIGADQLGAPRSRTPKGSEPHNEYSGANRSVDAGGILEGLKRQRKRRRRPRQKVTGPDSELPEDGESDENILDSDEESAVPCGDQWKAAASSDDKWNGSDSEECDDEEDDEEIQQSDSDAKSTDEEDDDGGGSDSDSADEKHVTRLSVQRPSKSHTRSRSKRAVAYNARRAITRLVDYRAKTEVTPRSNKAQGGAPRAVLDRRKGSNKGSSNSTAGHLASVCQASPRNDSSHGSSAVLTQSRVSGGMDSLALAAKRRNMDSAGSNLSAADTLRTHETKRAKFEKITDDGTTVSKFF